jgi:predicted Zn-dependent protease
VGRERESSKDHVMPMPSRIRSSLCVVVAATFLSTAFPPRPAQAVTTSREIQAGQAEDKRITRQYTISRDPLLNRWVNDIGARLWNQTARKDVPYNVKIIEDGDVNAFSTLGGYVYLNSGTLDFVQSDDELASVIGHETGHIERRHAVTYPAKAEALNLLLGITSLFMPFLSPFGQFGEAGVLAKASRTQEIQADQYGLLLMSRAGYDPDAMLSFMTHLQAAHADNDGMVDRYLADHPGFSDRAAHLVGYAELDPVKRTNEQILVQALRDQQAARYGIAAMKFRRLLKNDPGNPFLLLHLGELQIAQGLPNKAEQSLALAATKGPIGTRKQAIAEGAALRANAARPASVGVNISSLADRLRDALARQTENVAASTQRRAPLRDHLKALETRVRNLSSDAPDLSRMDARAGASGETTAKKITDMSRSLNAALENTNQVINDSDPLDPTLLGDMQSPLTLRVIPEQSRSILRSYPTMLADLERARADILRALDTSDSALAMLDAGLNDLEDLFHRFRQIRTDFNGNAPQRDYDALIPFMTKANASLDKAAAASIRAWQYRNLSRSRRMQTRITLLGLDFSPARYATLQYALRQRVENSGLDYAAMLDAGLTPGEVAAASIIAADTHAAPQDIVRQARDTHQSIIDIADTRNMSAHALTIFLGLVYLDYTDDPTREARDGPRSAPTITPPSITERS